MIRATLAACCLASVTLTAQDIRWLGEVLPPQDVTLAYGETYTLENATVQCLDPTQTGIRIRFPDEPASVAALTVMLSRVHVVGCSIDVWCTNCHNARIDTLVSWGSYATWGEGGILFDGRSTEVTVTAAHIWYKRVGIRVADTSERPMILNSALVGVEQGIVIATEQTVPERPGLVIRDTHIKATKRGIVTSWHPQAVISGNLIYQHETVLPGFLGIEIGTRSADTLLSSNTVFCQPNAGGTGLAVSSQAPRTTYTQLDTPLCATPYRVTATRR